MANRTRLTEHLSSLRTRSAIPWDPGSSPGWRVIRSSFRPLPTSGERTKGPRHPVIYINLVSLSRSKLNFTIAFSNILLYNKFSKSVHQGGIEKHEEHSENHSFGIMSFARRVAVYQLRWLDTHLFKPHKSAIYPSNPNRTVVCPFHKRVADFAV